MHYRPKYKKSIINKISLPLTTSLVFLATIFYWNGKNYGLALEYNGKQIATVNNQEVYNKARKLIRDEISENEKYKLTQVNPQIKITAISNNECCKQPEEIKNKIIENSDNVLKPAFTIYVDGQAIGIAKNKEEIENLLKEIKNEYKLNSENFQAEFEENIEIKKDLASESKILDSQKLKELLKNKIKNVTSYIVKQDDTVVSMAEKFGISPEELLKDNNKTENDSIFCGDTLKIVSYSDLLHVKAVSNISEEHEISFEKIVKEDETLEKGKKIISQEGINGKEKIIYQVTSSNGKEIEKKELHKEILQKPTEEITIVGTKASEYIWPVPYTKNITSGFGPRWGTFHYGIDISTSGVNGQEILAAKSGTVEIAKNGNTGYGNYILINHQDGTKTLYGHCKSLNVSAGEKVNQGDKIAYVGSTGDSTGPHLHFEVRVNNQKKNPINYIN